MKTRKAASVLGSLALTLVFVASFSNVASSSTIVVDDGFITEVGSTTTVMLTLDSVPQGLSGYILTVSISDTTIATITGVEFPSWATLTDQSLSGASVWMKAVDLSEQINPGDTDVSLGSLTIRATGKGMCEINATVSRADDDNGNPIAPSVASGALIVGQYDLAISSTAGGSVTSPGEGDFTYHAGTGVSLVASPATGYTFTEWVGDVGSIDDINAASTAITMNGDYSITATFAVAGEPDISVSTTWISFGNVTVGLSSAAQTVTVYNDGFADLHVGTIVIAGMDAGQFSIRNDHCSGETILPGRSATLEVVFNPISTLHGFYELSIPSDDPDEATVKISLTGTGVVGPPSTVTLITDPINVVADGASTSTLTSVVKDAEGNDVADGTPVSFTTDRGTLGSSTITVTTTNGVATATLTAPTERGIAVVQAQAGGISDYTAVFFKEPGQPDVVDSKTEATEPGTDTVDARGEANTTVTKSGDGTPTITVAQYDENPDGPGITAFASGYIDVYLDDTTDVNEVTICLYYPTTIDESKIQLYWWDEAASAWVLIDPQTKDTTDVDGYGGKVCIAVRQTGTIPTLDDLHKASFCAGV